MHREADEPEHERPREEARREQRAAVHEQRQQDHSRRDEERGEVDADAQAHHVPGEQQAPVAAVVAQLLPPAQRQVHGQDLHHLGERVDLGLGGRIPVGAREGEEERGAGARRPRDDLVALRALALLALGDAHEANRDEEGEPHRDGRRQHGEEIELRVLVAEGQHGEDAADEHVERRAGWMRDPEQVRGRDELARVPERNRTVHGDVVHDQRRDEYERPRDQVTFPHLLHAPPS